MSIELKNKIRDLLWLLQKGGDSISDTALKKIEESLEKVRGEYDPNDEDYDPEGGMGPEDELSSIYGEEDLGGGEQEKSPEELIAEYNKQKEQEKTEVATDKTSEETAEAVSEEDPLKGYSPEEKKMIQQIKNTDQEPTKEFSLEKDPELLSELQDWAHGQLSNMKHQEGLEADPAVNPMKAAHAHGKEIDSEFSHHDYASALKEYRKSPEYLALPVGKERRKAELDFEDKWEEDNADAVANDSKLLEERSGFAEGSKMANKKRHLDVAHDISTGGGVEQEGTKSAREVADEFGATGGSEEEAGQVSTQITPAQKVAYSNPEIANKMRKFIDNIKTDDDQKKKWQDVMDRYHKNKPHLEARKAKQSEAPGLAEYRQSEEYKALPQEERQKAERAFSDKAFDEKIKQTKQQTQQEKQSPAVEWFEPAHQKMIGHIINSSRIRDMANAAGVDAAELHEPARHGLLSALTTFDPSEGHKFVTHASKAIHGKIKSHLGQKDDIPSNIKREMNIRSKAPGGGEE